MYVAHESCSKLCVKWYYDPPPFTILIAGMLHRHMHINDFRRGMSFMYLVFTGDVTNSCFNNIIIIFIEETFS